VVASNWSGGVFGGVMWLVWLAFAILVIAGLWKVFVKAGHPGWGAIIPFYNTYLLIKVAGRPGWWLILMFIPVVNFIIWIIIALDIAKNFGHGVGYGILLILIPAIMYLVLGFGSDEYKPVTG
jgi:hypothetical protein